MKAGEWGTRSRPSFVAAAYDRMRRESSCKPIARYRYSSSKYRCPLLTLDKGLVQAAQQAGAEIMEVE